MASVEDLAQILDTLPTVHCTPIVNSLEENAFSARIPEAVLKREGAGSILMTFRQKSASIFYEAKALGNSNNPSDSEIKTNVTIKILPLQWIYSSEGAQT